MFKIEIIPTGQGESEEEKKARRKTARREIIIACAIGIVALVAGICLITMTGIHFKWR